jgi:hypothetical protein
MQKLQHSLTYVTKKHLAASPILLNTHTHTHTHTQFRLINFFTFGIATAARALGCGGFFMRH